jgi:hypothetical protein
MPDLLSVRRHGMGGDGAGPLASSRSAPQEIRPATASGLAPAPTRSAPLSAHGPSTADGLTAGLPAASSPPGTSQLPRAAVLPRSYLPAPPPISVRRSPAAAPAAAPAVPAVASDIAAATPTPGRPGAGAILRRTMRDSLGSAFGLAATAAGPSRWHADEQRGQHMAEDHQVIRRLRDGSTAGSATQADFEIEPVTPLPTTTSGQDLDEFVDRVVERIEQRVVDELERRGRRYHRGAF